MSEIDETALISASMAACRVNGCGLTIDGERALCDDARADPEVRRALCECRITAHAAILAYEQHWGKQEPVGWQVRFKVGGRWIGWHEPMPEPVGMNYAEWRGLADSRDDVEFRFLYASPQSADVGALRAALDLAANRLLRCVLEIPYGSAMRSEVTEWVDEARAALATSGGHK